MVYTAIDPGKTFGTATYYPDERLILCIEGDKELVKYLGYQDRKYIIEVPVGGDMRISMRAVGYIEGVLDGGLTSRENIIHQSPMKRQKFMGIAKLYEKGHNQDALAHLLAYTFEHDRHAYDEILSILEEKNA